MTSKQLEMILKLWYLTSNFRELGLWVFTTSPVYVVLGIKSKTSSMVGEHSTDVASYPAKVSSDSYFFLSLIILFLLYLKRQNFFFISIHKSEESYGPAWKTFHNHERRHLQTLHLEEKRDRKNKYSSTIIEPLIHWHYPGQIMSRPIPWSHKCAYYSNKLEECFLLFSTKHIPMGPFTVLKEKMPWKAHMQAL